MFSRSSQSDDPERQALTDGIDLQKISIKEKVRFHDLIIHISMLLLMTSSANVIVTMSEKVTSDVRTFKKSLGGGR